MDVDSPLKRCSSAPIIANRSGISSGTSSEGTTSGSSSGQHPSGTGTAITVEEDRVMVSQLAAGPMNRFVSIPDDSIK